jgi:hypothetical protein
MLEFHEGTSVVNEVLSSLLSDLSKVRKVCIEENLQEIPDICYTYLSANKEALQFFVQQVYSKTDVTQRRNLADQHQELDGSAIHDDFQPIAMAAFVQATHRQESSFARSFISVREDSLHMLLRALQFAKYCPLDPYHFDLWLSPIKKHGLSRKFGNFESITKEEAQAISWHVADVLYSAEKSKALAKCQSLGFDLKKRDAKQLSGNEPQWESEWIAILLELLRYKAECDLAVVLLKSPQKKVKYLNAIDNRLDSECANLISDARETLQHFFARLQSDSEGLPKYISVEYLLDPLRADYAELRSDLGDMEPRPTIYEAASKLLGIGKETVMGDKYEFHGQAAGVGRNVNIQTVNFNQLWDQSNSSLDLGKLADDLVRLREAMVKEGASAEQVAAVGNVASAEIEARNKRGPSALEYLSKAGKWALDVATGIGVPVAIEALKKSLGM